MPEQKAFVTAADGGGKTVAPMPMMQNACFLCSREIGESDPRQFYSPTDANYPGMMLAHTGCLNKFMANGEVWPGNDTVTPSLRVDDLGDVRRVVYGHARVVFTPYLLKVPCDDIIAEKGLKAVIPDLIVALKAAEEAL